MTLYSSSQTMRIRWSTRMLFINVAHEYFYHNFTCNALHNILHVNTAKRLSVKSILHIQHLKCNLSPSHTVSHFYIGISLDNKQCKKHLLGSIKPCCNILPICNFPYCIYIIWPHIFILQVVCMFPHINSKEGY